MIRDRHAYMLIQKYIRMMNTKKKFKDFSNFILIIKVQKIQQPFKIEQFFITFPSPKKSFMPNGYDND